MVEITHLMDLYRESTRHIWNVYFVKMEQGWHEFIDVDMALFQGLVLTHIGETCYPGNTGIYHPIQITPQLPPSKCLPVLICSKEAGQWKKHILKSQKGQFFFKCFFDWRNPMDMMDNEYVQAYINKSENDEINGKFILIKYADVKFFAEKLISQTE